MTDVPEMPDMMVEALQQNRVQALPALPPTETRRKLDDGTVAVFSSTTPEAAKAWTDDMIVLIGQMAFAAEIDGWENENDRRLTILHTYFPDQYQRLLDALWDARENVKTLTW
jgi:hypothetical protein